MNKAKWIQNCKLCNDGIVIAVRERLKLGMSERAACKDLMIISQEEYPELADEFTFGAVYNRWQRHGREYDMKDSAEDKFIRGASVRGTSNKESETEVANSEPPKYKPPKKKTHADELGPDARTDPFTGLREDDVSTLINHKWMNEVTAGEGTLITINKNMEYIEPTFMLSNTISAFRNYAKRILDTADRLEEKLNDTKRNNIRILNK